MMDDVDKTRERELWEDGKGWGGDAKEAYASVFGQRARGELPEMESSKALAKIVSGIAQDGDRILDVGCGAGHYLLSLRKAISHDFSYMGVDATDQYIQLARDIHVDQADVAFQTGSIFDLQFGDSEFDVVLCSNVLLHLPSIETPIRELCRVGKRMGVFRTLVGDRSFRIQEIRGTGDEFNEDGSPIAFNYYNIYSRAYVERILSGIPRVREFSIDRDNDFDGSKIDDHAESGSAAGLSNATYMLGDWQVNGYVLQPWSFVTVSLDD